MRQFQRIKNLSYKGKSGLVRRYFLYFFIVFIIPVIISSAIIYSYSIKAMEDEARQSNTRILTSLSKIIDERIRETEEILQLLNSNQNIWGLIDAKQINMDFDNIEKTVNLSGELKSVILNRNYIEDVYVYFDSSDYVVSAKNGVYSYTDFFNHKNRYNGIDLKGSQDYIKNFKGYRMLKTMKVLKGNPAVEDYPASSVSIITMMNRIPYTGTSKATIVVNIDEKELFKSINSDTGYDEDILVLNDTYEKISYVGKKFDLPEQDQGLISKIQDAADNMVINIDGEATFITYITSNYKQWKYVALIPMKLLVKKAAYIRNITVLVCLLFLVMGYVTSVLMSRKVYNPIKEISKKLLGFPRPTDEMKNGVMNELSHINSSLNSLFNENSRLTSIYDVSKDLVKEKLVYRIIQGDISKKEEIEKQIELYNLEFPSRIFASVLIKIDYFNAYYLKMTEDEKRLIHRKVKNVLNSLLKDNGAILVELEDNQFSAIIFFTRYDESVFKLIIDEMMNKLEVYSAHMDANIAVGSVMNDFLDLKLQYRQLKYLAQNRVFGTRNQVLYLSEVALMTDNDENIYIEQKIQLKNALLNGDYKHSIMLIEKVVEKCLELKLSYKRVKIIFTGVLNNVISVLEEADCKTEEVFEDYYSLYEQLEAANDPEQLQKFFCDVLSNIVKHIQSRKLKNEDSVVRQILDEINNHYDKQLSLDYMAERMGLSTSYFSAYFKEKVGENFIEYLNKVRINKAKQQLMETDLKIKDISEMVGYLSCNTFNIVFKKYVGTSPGTYKKNAGK